MSSVTPGLCAATRRSSRASATLRRWDRRTPREPSRSGTAPSAHRAGAHPTRPPRTTQHRPSASATGAARSEPPAIGRTLHSAISAYRAVRALIGPERRGRRGPLAGRCRVGAPPPGPSAGPNPPGWLELLGPGCERGARWLLWLLSARDAGDPAVPRPRRALTDALRRQPFTLEEGKWRSGRFRAVTSGLAEARSPGRAALPRSSRASGLRGHLLLEAAGQCRLGAAFPAPSSLYANSFLPSICCN